VLFNSIKFYLPQISLIDADKYQAFKSALVCEIRGKCIHRVLIVLVDFFKNFNGLFIDIRKSVLHLYCYEHTNSNGDPQTTKQEICGGLFCPGFGVTLALKDIPDKKPGP